MHAGRRKGLDRILGQAQLDVVGRHAGDRARRDDDLPPPSEVAALEHDVGELLLVVKDEPVDMAEVMLVR